MLKYCLGTKQDHTKEWKRKNKNKGCLAPVSNSGKARNAPQGLNEEENAVVCLLNPASKRL
jgi:hypothetical protein